MNFTTQDRQQVVAIGSWDDVAASLRHLTVAELQILGITRLAYLTGQELINGAVVYTVHGADGAPLAVVDEVDVAVELVYSRNMILLPVH
jgi:hypothetical protein